MSEGVRQSVTAIVLPFIGSDETDLDRYLIDHLSKIAMRSMENR